MPPKKDNGNNTSGSNIASLSTPLLSSLTATPEMNSKSTSAAPNTANTAGASSSMASDLAAEQRQQLYLANAKLCNMVKKNKWMYDRNHPNYAKKQILDKSWAKIAKDCNDSVASCKERWRNIRAAFARSINIYKTNSGPNRVKPYYLHKELAFIVKPMMNGREKSKDDQLLDTKEELEDEVNDDDDDDAENIESDGDGDETATLDIDEHENNSNLAPQMELNSSDVEMHFNFSDETNATHDRDHEPEIIANYRRRPATESLANDHTEAKRLKSNNRSTAAATGPAAIDLDAQFFEGLLPDMRVMNARQKITFKRKIYQSLEEVLDSSADFPAATHSLSTAPNASSTAQSVMNRVACLNESDLPQLMAFMENNFTHSTQRIQNGAVTSTPQIPTTSVPRAVQQNKRVAGPQSSTRQNATVGSPWNQLVPISVKDEVVEDVDVD